MVPFDVDFNINHQTFSQFLSNPEPRHLYNKTLAATKLFHEKNANKVFLENCIKSGHIPQSFKIKNEPKPNSSPNFIFKWKQAAKNTSILWIKNAIKDSETWLKKQFQNIRQLKENLMLLCPPDLLDELIARLTNKSHMFSKITQERKMKKESWLKKKQTVNVDEGKTAKKRDKWMNKNKWRRLKKRQSKQKINVIFNYSSIVLTEAMENLLNRGLNFVITPLSLDMSQVLVDFAKFERSLLWKEFFAGSEEQQTYIPPLFKTEKTNRPTKHKTPEELKTFIHAVKSEIMDPQNRNKCRPNLPPAEIAALNTLIHLQKTRLITVKPCDKGAGIIILDFDKYLDSCTTHLSSSKEMVEGMTQPYYQEVSANDVIQAKEKISKVLDLGLREGWISENEAKAMDPGEKKPGKFYQLFKVHKKHEPGTTPPGRPIISGSGSFTENISVYVDQFLKPMSTVHPSYLQDTPDFLRCIEDLNKTALPENAILFTMDVQSLYTNIPQDEGLKICEKILNKRTDQSVPTSFIISLLNLCLKENLFEFNNKLFRQLLGTAMGIHPAPSYANLYMADIDEQIGEQAAEIEEDPLKLYKRFLDDIFGIWAGNLDSLYEFVKEINKINPCIKFTLEHSSPFRCDINAEHDCWCHTTKFVPFLDTKLYIEDGKITTDLYRKETDRCMYLLPSSAHPAHIAENIPFSLCYRIVRICSKPELRDMRLAELRSFLMHRNYNGNLVDTNIEKARLISRPEALKRVERVKTPDRVVLSILYNPRLPSISQIINKHWRTMTLDPWMKEVYSLPPMVSFRRPPNLREKLIKAKVPEEINRPKRVVHGMKKCKRNCVTCPYVEVGKSVHSSYNTQSVQINGDFDCTATNVIYSIVCTKCGAQYIGKTERSLDDRAREHLGYIRNHTHHSTGQHFNGPGHGAHHLRISVLEKVWRPGTMLIKTRESMYIREFETDRHGLNKRK